MSLKRKILIFLFGGTACLIAWYLLAPRIRLDAAARDFDLAALPLRPLPLFNKSFIKLENGMEAGTVRLKSGEVVRYWFISRHIQPGSGLTRFDFPKGESVYMEGAWCCEVTISEEATESEGALKRYIASMDGTAW